MSVLANGINTIKAACTSSLLGSFSENQDVPRFASVTQDMALAKNVIAFTILSDGIPISQSSTPQLPITEEEANT
jgi:alpha-amylase